MPTDEPPTILKRDALGRVSVPQAQREALLDEFERSGLKGQPFARLAGVNYQTFASWIQKRRHARGDYPSRRLPDEPASLATRKRKLPLRLVEAVVASTTAVAPTSPALPTLDRGLEIILPGGAKMILAEPSHVALAVQLLDSLSAPC